MKVSSPPAGTAGSAKVFRASKSHLQLELLSWGVGQVFTLVGLFSALPLLNAF